VNGEESTVYDREIVAPTSSPPRPATDLEPLPPAGRGGRGLSRVALVLALLPLAVSAVFLVVKAGGTYAPAADNAIMELTTRDVGHHPVLVGLVSRDGWSHPGPVLFYLLAAPYRLTGGSSIALPLGALAINGAAIAGMAVVARRRGGLRLMLLTLVAGGLLVRALGPEFMADVWNPYIPVLCFGFFVFLTWEMTCGETWALPVAAGVGTFCIQTHIGYLPLVVPLLAWGIAWLVWSMAKANRLAALARVGLVTAAVLSVLWLPPLVDEVLHSPGNLTEIVDYFRHPHQHAHTLTAGYRVVGAQFELTPEWLTGLDPPSPFTGEPLSLYSNPVPVLLLPLAASALVLWRRRNREARRLVATLGVALAIGVLAVARTLGALYAYRLRWTWVLAMIAAAVVAWTAWTWVARVAPRAEKRWLIPLSVGALAILAVANAVSAAREVPPGADQSAQLRALIPSVVAALPPGDGDVIVRGSSFSSTFYASGLVLALERRHLAPRVDPTVEVAFHQHRVHRKGKVREILTVATNDTFEAFVSRPDLRLVAYSGTVPPAERARLVERASALDRAHNAGELDNVAYYVRRTEVARRLDRPAVGVFAPRVAPRRGPPG
jgi:uncharacterized membrane protein